MYMMNIPFILRAIWVLVKNILDPSTQRKIQMVKPGSKELFACINKSQIEQKYGGTAPNVTDNFFPHNTPSNDYFVEEDKPEELLLSDEEYKIKVEADDRIVKSPYYVPTPAAIFEAELEKEEIKTCSNIEEKVTRNLSVTSDLKNCVYTELEEKELDLYLPIENEFFNDVNDVNDKNQNVLSLKTFFVRPKLSFNVPRDAYKNIMSSPTPSTRTSSLHMHKDKDNKRIRSPGVKSKKSNLSKLSVKTDI